MPPPTVCIGRRVVVTGMGAVTPLGRTLQSSLESLFLSRSGSAAIQPAEVYEAYGIPRVAAAQVKDENETNDEPGRRALGAQEPRGMAFARTAASEAVTASGGADALRAAYNNGDGIGVAFGTGISGVEELLGAQAALETRGFRRVSPYLVPNSLVNMAAGRISIANGFRGPNHAVSTACATGAHAIGDAFRFIKYGDADVRVRRVGWVAQCCWPLPAASLIGLMTNERGADAAWPLAISWDIFVGGLESCALALWRRSALSFSPAPPIPAGHGVWRLRRLHRAGCGRGFCTVGHIQRGGERGSTRRPV